MYAGERLAESGTPTGLRLVRPVAPVDPIEHLLIGPPKIDREAALRMIQEGNTLEALGSMLVFSPMLRDELLRLRRK